MIPRGPFKLIVQSSDGGGWDHVSVSRYKKGCPSWDDMVFIKALFFDEEECVVQYHPAKSEYINNAKNCLHLWRYQDENFPIPSSGMIGIKELN